MDIGKLNRRIQILEFQEERDEYGGADGSWVVINNVWANIKQTVASEFFYGQEKRAEATVTITIRYNSRVNVLNRIKYMDKTYEIIGVNDEDTAHFTTILTCKEIVEYGV